MKSIFYKIFVFCFALSLNAAYAFEGRIIVFGDSYSDNGNVFKLTKQQYPNAIAYYKGRFSDGPVWSEYFASLNQVDPNDPSKFLNFAYGQAKIMAPTSITVYANPDKTYKIPSFSDEIDTYQKIYKTFKPNDLILVFIGTNDFFDMPAVQAEEFFKNLADKETQELKRLISLGATKIIVLNGRDVTLSPLAKIFTKDLQGFQNLIKIYNSRLNENVASLKAVKIYDIFSFDHAMTPTVNYINMCYQNIKGDYQHIAGTICKDPENFFYYDRIHTTSNINLLLANDVCNKILK